MGEHEPKRRIVSLDAVRGCAALVVVLHHCSLIYASRFLPTDAPWRPGWRLDLWSWLDHTPFGEIADGRKAVLVFFILSGLVLALALQSQSAIRFKIFAIKRVARIYIPFAVSILLSAVLYEMARPMPIPGLSHWFNERTWPGPLTPGLVFGDLLMTDSVQLQTLDNVMWSLVDEIRISMLFPFMLIALKTRERASLIAIFAVSVVAHAVADKLPDTLDFNPFETLQYLYLFAVGAMMAIHADALMQAFGKLPRAARLALWGLTILLLAYPRYGRLGFYLSGAGSAAIVALCFLDRSAIRLLAAAVPQWLGKVSYSLYLVHVPVIIFVVHIGHDRLPLPALIGLGVVLSMAVAEAMQRAVEAPAIALGRLAISKLRFAGAVRAA